MPIFRLLSDVPATARNSACWEPKETVLDDILKIELLVKDCPHLSFEWRALNIA